MVGTLASALQLISCYLKLLSITEAIQLAQQASDTANMSVLGLMSTQNLFAGVGFV